ncbi:uncharacterized protein RBU33_011581 isoform 3-T3 [Hipposideros larvatus]
MEERETEEVGGRSSRENTATVSAASLPPCIGNVGSRPSGPLCFAHMRHQVLTYDRSQYICMSSRTQTPHWVQFSLSSEVNQNPTRHMRSSQKGLYADSQSVTAKCSWDLVCGTSQKLTCLIAAQQGTRTIVAALSIEGSSPENLAVFRL